MELPETPSFRFDGKRALVAGASRRIGLAAAAAVAEAGAQVTCAARSETDLEVVSIALKKAGYSAEVAKVDVCDVNAIGTMLADRDSFDVVVNAAGMARHGPALDTTEDDYHAVMNVNLRGAYFLSSCAAGRLIEVGKPGSIIHISSQIGHVGGIDRAVYCASRHGLEGLCKSMAIEWGSHDVRIGEIEDIMGAVYLASDASRLVTGTSLLVDGGWTAG